ncbi:hypothetical protein ACFL4Q_01975 [candidate division KSB1 bacterium]
MKRKIGNSLYKNKHLDGQRYFDFNHSDNDPLSGVHPREMELGTAAQAILAYLTSEKGL